MIYLDYAATTPVDKEVQEVIHYHLAETFGNPSSNYPVGQAAHEVLEQSRQQIAATIGVQASEVIFTSGATEADNWAVMSQARRARELGRGDHLVSTRIEHPAVMEALAQLEHEGFQVTYLEPENQEYRLEAFQAATTDQTTGWIAMAVNNEVGSRLPVEALGQAALDQGLWFHTDTAQAINNLALNLTDLPCTSCVMAGHKLYAPKGIGVLVYRPLDSEMVLEPQVIGGGQEGGLRSGTENIPYIAGLAKAVELAYQDSPQLLAQYRQLQDQLFQGLKEAGIEYEVNGSKDYHVPYINNLWIQGHTSYDLIPLLADHGIYLSAGSACHAGQVSDSAILRLYHPETPDRWHESLRISFGRYTTASDIDELVQQLRQIIQA